VSDKDRYLWGAITVVLILLILTVIVNLVIAYDNGVAAQEPPKSWLIWKQPDNSGSTESFNGQVYLYKIQDGSCSVYVGYSNHGAYSGDDVSVSTGQGCK
jgi:hypothetical protein